MKLSFDLYTRSGCHLCDEMEQGVEILQSTLNFTVDVITINGDTQLEARYGDKVPVLARGDNIICQYVLDEDALIQAIQ